MMTHEPDQDRTEAFAGQMLAILNGASLALMISIGHQTGLFDTLAGLPPATSEQIAQAAGLNERYVREWLGAMVTGRILEYDPIEGRYRLPPEHAASLTRDAGSGNLAVFMQYIPLLGNVEGEIIACFREGGGVPYSAYPRFQQLQAEESRALFDGMLLEAILPLVPGLVERLQTGIEVADIGCGQGHAVNQMGRAFPDSRFVGYDLSEGGIAAGRAQAEQMGLSNTRFEVRDTTTLDAPGRYDLITAFDTIHDQGRPVQVLQEIAHALRPEGTFLMADVAASSRLEENLEHPLAPMLYTFSCMHCMTVSLAQAGEGLGAMWGEQKARQMLAEAGFTRVDVKQVAGDTLNNYYIAMKGEHC